MSNPDGPLPKGVQLTPYDPGFMTDPYPILADLRERAPVHHDDQFNRWYLTRFDDVRALLRDKDMSSDPYKANPNSFMGRLAIYGAGTEVAGARAAMIFLDDPDHRRLRSLVNRTFTPKAVELVRPRIRAIAQALLAQLDSDEFDLMASIAGPLPVIVIAEMLGIDAKDRDDFKRWSDAVVYAFFNPFRSEEARASGVAAQDSLNQYFQRMIDERRAVPREDLIMEMVRAEEAGDRMTDAEIIMQCNLLLVAGNVTTTDLIGNGVKALLEHPEQLAKLRAQPELMANAVEEILRFDTPVVNVARNVQRETALRGCPLRLGDTVSASLGAANHDPQANPEPQRFDIERADIQHQSFGGGKHLCLGAPLARAEAQETLAALLERFPQLRLSPRGVRYRNIPGFRGMAELWLQASPGPILLGNRGARSL
jgi:cytochrome P450